jgi:hypothetical protein
MPLIFTICFFTFFAFSLNSQLGSSAAGAAVGTEGWKQQKDHDRRVPQVKKSTPQCNALYFSSQANYAHD